jgi:hypothetical protein
VDAIRAFLEDWLGTYEEYLAEVEEVLDLGHGVVFVAYREDGRRWAARVMLNGGRRRSPSGPQA